MRADDHVVLLEDPAPGQVGLVPAARTPADRRAAPATGAERVLAEVLAEVLGVDQVAVDGHFFDDLGADSMVMARFCARVRKRPDLPSVSMKDVYQHPTIRSLAAGFAAAPPAPAEREFVTVLADVLGVDHVGPESHFFDDLGADSMVMARFCARVRKRADLPQVSMKDVYQHPTIRSLIGASTVDTAPPPEPAAPARSEAAAPVGTGAYLICGALQALTFVLYTYAAAVVALRGYEWLSAGNGIVDDYLRAVVFGSAFFVGMSVLPVLAKWVLIGRWTRQEIPVWSLAYVRFWIVKTLIRANPLILVSVGSPLYVLYLRALGAKVGRGVAVFSKSVPVCTDLLTIGDGTVIRKDAVLSGYRAHFGVIQTGAVTIGRDVVIGDSAVLDIDTSLGDGAQLGHRSSLHAGQAVPAGERWHGSPGRRTEEDYRSVAPVALGGLRRAGYGALHLLTVLLVTLPLGLGGLSMLIVLFPGLGELLDTGALALASTGFYVDALVGSAVLFFGAALSGLLYVLTVPRLLHLVMEPDRVYPLYGFHYSVHRTILRTTNSKFLTQVFGNSSYIVHYLQGIGYELRPVEQTGSNFGVGVKHETPFLSSVGSGTVVADGLSLVNAEYSSSSFRVTRTRIGAHNFLGNAIVYPAQGRTGDDCLLATKVMVPIDGPVREGVGLLGSPAFVIPRSVARDATFDDLAAGDELARRLAGKNRYNRRTIGWFLLVRWLNFYCLTVITLVGFELQDRFGAASVAAATVVDFVFALAFAGFAERLFLRFRPLEPRFCSIYDPYFWWHERYWKFAATPNVLNGTPFKSTALRLMGARIGRRVFDDGASLPEKTLVTVGDGCTLNAGTTLQSHSQEDDTFKSEHVMIGAGCTIGVSAWVHYGVTMGEGAELVCDSFLMKGEDVPPHARWGGNPAGELPAATADPRRPVRSVDDRVPLPGSESAGRHRAPDGAAGIAPAGTSPQPVGAPRHG